jgi:hypothetical protein
LTFACVTGNCTNLEPVLIGTEPRMSTPSSSQRKLSHKTARDFQNHPRPYRFKHTCGGDDNKENLRHPVDKPDALARALDCAQDDQGSECPEGNYSCRLVRSPYVFDDEDNLLESCVGMHDLLQRGEAEHRDKLLAETESVSGEGLYRIETDTMMTTATAEMKPWSRAWLRTTSMKPRRKKPKINENRPAWRVIIVAIATDICSTCCFGM